MNQCKQIYTNAELLTDGTTLDLERALACDVDNDPECLLGDRFLCRGSGGFIFGPSAIGKSSFAVQMACCFAVGEDFFGITTYRNQALKVLLVQAENDAREIAEVLQSVTEGWSEPTMEMLFANLVVETLWDKMGPDFASWLENAVVKHGPDLVIVDPFMSYVGEDAASNQAITKFLRTHLMKPLKKQRGEGHQFGIIFTHHTGKPTGKPEDEKNASARMYGMFGASELVNWARCIMRIKEDDVAGKFLFSAPKRGDRSGMPALPNGDWGCAVKHAEREKKSSKRVLRWLPADSGSTRSASARNGEKPAQAKPPTPAKQRTGRSAAGNDSAAKTENNADGASNQASSVEATPGPAI
jgi:hypothetical protein